jgi:iron complex transport system substrate-binding protein
LIRVLTGTVLLALAGCAQPTRGGSGIVSVNPCADALLVRLAPERIAAISHYSHDPAATSLPLAVARRYRATAGTAEEVIALRPSLVLASTFTQPATRDAYARAGLRVVYLDSPQTVAASIAQVRDVAVALGERGRGEALAGAILRSLQSPGRREQADPRDPAALLLISGDLATGGGTLLDELLTRAGFRNAAADHGLAFSGRVPLERLVARPPSVVIAPDSAGRTAALRRRLLPGTPEARFPRALINCGGPSIPPALARLRAIRASLR